MPDEQSSELKVRMTTSWRIPAGLLLAVVVASCGEAPQAQEELPPAAEGPAPENPATLRYAPELNIDIAEMTPAQDGVYIEDVRQGTGREAQAGQQVTVEYQAWLPDGTLFEQRPSPEGFGPSSFVIGMSPPVPGLNAGITGMRAGGVRRIVVPPAQGYGLVGRPEGVPPNSTLVFEVRLVSVQQ